MPFMGSSLFSSSRGTLDSDPVIRAAADKALLETTEVTPEYVMAGKLAAGETGESLNADVIAGEVARLNRLKSDNIQRLDNEIRTGVRGMTKKDDVLGNIVTDISSKMNADDLQRLYFKYLPLS